MYGRVSFTGLSLCGGPRRKVLYVLAAIWKVRSRWGWKPMHDAVYRWIRKRAMRWALEECCVRNRWVNRPSSRWRHLTKTIRIHFVFHFLISLVSPPTKLNKPNTIYPRKKKQTEVSTLRWNFPMSSFSWKTNTRRCYWWQWCGSGGELEAWPQEWYSMAQADLNYCNLPLIQVYVVKKLMDRFSQKIETKSRNSDGDVW